MFPKLELTKMAQALAAHSGARMGVIAENVAQADTPGYKARDLPDFATIYVVDAGLRATRSGHLSGAAGDAMAEARVVAGNGAPNGNTVSLEGEMVRAAGVRQSHEMALAIYRNTSELSRLALGRGR